MKRPITTWDRVTRCAWIFAIFYLLAILVTQPDWHWWGGWSWPDWLRDIANAGLAVALMVISIWYGGILTDFYSKLTGFGISEVRQDRRGADSQSTTLWMERIVGSDTVQIVGTLSRGWFVVAYDNLHHLLSTNDKIKLDIFLLDPFGKVWRSKIESEQDDYKKFLHETDQVFWNLHALLKEFGKRVKIKLYDSEPISCVIARGAIYLGLYLPQTSRKSIPEFTISTGSFLGSKVNESMSRIDKRAPSVTAGVIKEYRELVVGHANSAKETFWGDPKVFCDFCKELRSFPSEITRRHPGLIDGSRIAFRTNDFFIVPSLGPLMDDHALIVSTNHITSSAKLAETVLANLVPIFQKFVAEAESREQTQLFFEHGVPDDSGGYGGCGVCHCHIHTLSISKTYNPLENLEGFLAAKNCKYEKKSIESWTRVGVLAGDSYLTVQIGTQAPVVFIFKPGTRVESQLMRQFIASDCPDSYKDWDWRDRWKKSTSSPEPVPDDQIPDAVGKAKLDEEERRIRSASDTLKRIFA